MRIAAEWVTCPYCWERIEVALDLSVPEQQYVEDCFVCCRPIAIHYISDGDEVVEVTASAENS
jgi:hypothetical protein